METISFLSGTSYNCTTSMFVVILPRVALEYGHTSLAFSITFAKILGSSLPYQSVPCQWVCARYDDSPFHADLHVDSDLWISVSLLRC